MIMIVLPYYLLHLPASRGMSRGRPACNKPNWFTFNVLMIAFSLPFCQYFAGEKYDHNSIIQSIA
jgi:hypothetical protein